MICIPNPTEKMILLVFILNHASLGPIMFSYFLSLLPYWFFQREIWPLLISFPSTNVKLKFCQFLPELSFFPLGLYTPTSQQFLPSFLQTFMKLKTHQLLNLPTFPMKAAWSNLLLKCICGLPSPCMGGSYILLCASHFHFDKINSGLAGKNTSKVGFTFVRSVPGVQRRVLYQREYLFL